MSLRTTDLALLDNGATRLFISAETEDGDRKAIDAINVDTGGAIINYGTREVFITGTFVNGDTTVEFGISGQVENLAPRIELSPPLSLDCGFGVMLQAEIEDVDGDPARARVAWFIDGRRVEGVDQASVVVDLAVGVHEVLAVVADEDGGFASTETTVTINPDTTPPQIVSPESDLCLWPPDHRLALLEPSSLGFTVIDECDPSPTIELVSGTSSQPENGVGDGDTIDDISVNPGAACVRAERQALDRDGRVYTITARARDAAGNTSSEVEAIVRVPHSMPLPAECRRVRGERVSESDPRCGSPPNGLLQTRAEAGGGCRVGRGSGGVLAFFAVLWVLIRRRRS